MKNFEIVMLIVFTITGFYCLFSLIDSFFGGCSCCAGGFSKECCHYGTPQCIDKDVFFENYKPKNYEDCFSKAIIEYWNKDCMIGKTHIGCCSYGWKYSEEICKKYFGVLEKISDKICQT